jgi:hypothetical protein
VILNISLTLCFLMNRGIEIRETGKHRIRQPNIFIYRALSETKELVEQFIVTLLWKE